FGGCGGGLSAPETRKMVLETVDGMLAHRKQEANGRYVTRTEINFKTDEDLPGGDATPDFMFWAAYRWTGDKKYLLPFMDTGPSSLAHISSDALDRSEEHTSELQSLT